MKSGKIIRLLIIIFCGIRSDRRREFDCGIAVLIARYEVETCRKSTERCVWNEIHFTDSVNLLAEMKHNSATDSNFRIYNKIKMTVELYKVVVPCSMERSLRFGGTYRFHRQD
jgi:hypothetical protein